MRWHPFFESAYSGGGFTLGVGHANYVSGYNYHRCARQLYDRRLQARRGRVRRPADVQPSRRAVGDRRLARGDAGRLLRLGTNTSKDDRTNYLFQQPYGNALLTLFPTRQGADAARRRRVHPVVAGVRRRARSLRSRPDTRQRTCPVSEPRSPTCTRRARWGSTGAPRPATPAAAASSAPPCTTTTIATTNSAFRLMEYEAIEHIPILREAWVLSFRGRVQTACEKDGQQTPFFMLPARRRRLVAARLQQLALPRSEQHAAAGRVAHHGQPLPRDRVLLRRRQGHRADERPRLRRAEERFRLRHPHARPVLHAAPRRAGQEPRRPVASSSRRPLSSKVSLPCRYQRCRHVPAASGSWFSRPVRSASSPPAPRRRGRASIPTIRSRASLSRRTPRRRRPTTSRRCTSWSTTCSSRPATSRAACARRTSTRSTRCRTRAGSPTASAPGRSPTRSSCAARTSARRPTRRNGC